MPSGFALSFYALSTWIIPLVIAITFHEAAHGFVARLLGDNTAWLRGRVTFNPLKHIDPFGTILLPALLLFMHSPFLLVTLSPCR
jgi:Zn-dependent protease